MSVDIYNSLGVSSVKEELHGILEKSDKGIFPGAFCKILPDAFGGDPHFCNVIHSDGAGTKAALAYLYWKETGDLSVWKGIARDVVVMNTDDLLCVGADNNIIFSLIINRNKSLIPTEVLSIIFEGVEEFLSDMRSYGINIQWGGGETADVGDLVRTISLDGSVACRMKRESVISNDKIKEGDVIIGLSSYGKTIYEKEYNSGIACNGLTLARHALFNKETGKKYPETYNQSIANDLHYSGNFSLLEKVKFTDENNLQEPTEADVAKLLLSPARTYLPFMKEVFVKYRSSIHGLVHCTGGGQTKALRFIKDLHIIKNNLLNIPPVFKLIQKESSVSWKEMFRVFNMGYLMEIYLPPVQAPGILALAEKWGLEAKIIGKCEKGEGKQMTIESEAERFRYKS